MQSLLSGSAFACEWVGFINVLNGCAVTTSVCEFSEKGWSLEIIGIREQEKENFRKSISCAVSYMQNDLTNWLLQNFEVCLAAKITSILFLLANIRMLKREMKMMRFLSISHPEQAILQFANY
jgi:hypothetical protein